MAPSNSPDEGKVKEDLDALVAAVQLLLSDHTPALQHTVISRALPELVLMSPANGAAVKRQMDQVSLAAKELSSQMDGSSGLGVQAVRNLKSLVEAIAYNANAARFVLGIPK